MNLAAYRERADHDAEAELEGGEIAEALGKVPPQPGHQRVNHPIQCRQGEIGLVAKAKLRLHQEVEIVEIVNGAEGVQAFEDEAAGLEPSGEHGGVKRDA